MAPVPLLDLQLQFAPLREDILRAVEEVFDSQSFILGDQVTALEEEVAAYSGARHGVGVSSGTVAILICMMAEAIGPGDGILHRCPVLHPQNHSNRLGRFVCRC